MHQNAIAAGSVEPKGSGAAATVAREGNDEIRFDGASRHISPVADSSWCVRENYSPLSIRSQMTGIVIQLLASKAILSQLSNINELVLTQERP